MNKNRDLKKKRNKLQNVAIEIIKGHIYRPLSIDELETIKRIYKVSSYLNKKNGNNINKVNFLKLLEYFLHTYNPKNFSIKSNLTSVDIKVTLYLLEVYKKIDLKKVFIFLTPREKQVLRYELKRLNTKKEKTKKDNEDIKFYNFLLENFDYNSFFRTPNTYFQKEGR